MRKYNLPNVLAAKLEGWRKIARKYADSELYGYDGATDTREPGSVAEHFNNVLIEIEELLKY